MAPAPAVHGPAAATTKGVLQVGEGKAVLLEDLPGLGLALAVARAAAGTGGTLADG
jgi:hypothetical protein